MRDRSGGLQTSSRKRGGRAAAVAAGGHYLISTGNITKLDGAAPEKFALIEFDSIEKAQAWYTSPAQKTPTQSDSSQRTRLHLLSRGSANEWFHLREETMAESKERCSVYSMSTSYSR